MRAEVLELVVDDASKLRVSLDEVVPAPRVEQRPRHALERLRAESGAPWSERGVACRPKRTRLAWRDALEIPLRFNLFHPAVSGVFAMVGWDCVVCL